MMLRMRKKTSKEVSLYEPIGTDKEGNEISLLDIIESAQTDIAEAMDTRADVQKLFLIWRTTLNEREQEVLKMRYGLFGGEDMTQREIAQKLGISRSYVSRIEKQALAKLRKEFEKKEK